LLKLRAGLRLPFQGNRRKLRSLKSSIDECGQDVRAPGLWRDRGVGVAPAALAAGTDRGDAQPVAGAAGQAADRRA
jgi:hypothetical protein